jgi:DNA modification methylase
MEHTITPGYEPDNNPYSITIEKHTPINNIYNMDCKEGLNLIQDKSIDLVVMDLPYIIENKGGGMMAKKDKEYLGELEDIKDGFNLELLDLIIQKQKRINIYIFCSLKQIIPLTDYFVTKHKCNWNLLTWHKDNPVPACNNKYINDTEYILFFREPGVKLYGNSYSKKTYFNMPLNQADKKTYKHPTIKPERLIKRLIYNSSKRGDIVLDPFLGSGTTGVCAVDLSRNFVGFEINPKYYEIAKQRIQFTIRQTKLF